MRLFGFLSLWCFALGHDYSRNPFIKDAGPLVRTFSGAMLGKYVKVFDTNIAAFLGIPYAKPPVFERRFRKPKPLDSWEGILDATEKPSPCMQYSSRNYSWIPKTTTPSEDCLYLNVWTPVDCCHTDHDRLPVLVWLHGGGFYSGSTDMDVYDGSMLSAYSHSIVITINYRLGIFGFLNSGTPQAPGNAGLLDQNLALKWIKRNVAYLGGDVNNITIMGQSAGAWSISLHMVSPMSRNLFNRVILQSGTAYHPLLVDSHETAYMKANQVGKIVGCVTGYYGIEYDPDVIECLKYKNPWELAKAEDMFTSKYPLHFLPTYGDEFLPISPVAAINEGRVAPVDILIGNTKDEGTTFLNYIMPDIFKLYSEPQINMNAAAKIIGVIFQPVPQPPASQIIQQYFQNLTDDDPREIVQAISHAFGDFIFYCPAKFFAEKFKNVFMYWMTHRSTQDQQANWLGVQHSYDVPFVFGVPIHDTENFSWEDTQLSVDVIRMWAAFSQKGHPLADKNPDNWPRFTANQPHVFELNAKGGGVLPHPRASACEFWRPYITYVPPQPPQASESVSIMWPHWSVLEKFFRRY